MTITHHSLLITHYCGLALNAFRRHDLTSHGGRGGNRGVGQIDASVLVTHAAGEVAIAGGNTHVVRPHDAHVAAQAWTAGTRCHYGSRVREDLDQTFFKSLLVDVLRGRDHDALHI